jgi:hypothetical protein
MVRDGSRLRYTIASRVQVIPRFVVVAALRANEFVAA